MKNIYLSLLGLTFSLMTYSQGQTPQKENGWYQIMDGQKDSISQEPIVTVKDFVELNFVSDSFGKSAILGKVSKLKLNKWANATEKSIGKRIGFIFNDTVITDPQINARIETGNFQISNPHGYDLKRIYRHLLKEKANFADSLSEDYFQEHKLDMTKYKKLEESLEKELEKPNLSSRASDYMMSDAYKKYKSYICEYPDCMNLMFHGFLFRGSVKGLYGHLIDDIVKSCYPSSPSIWIMATDMNNKDDEATTVLKYQKRIRQLRNEERNKNESSIDSI